MEHRTRLSEEKENIIIKELEKSVESLYCIEKIKSKNYRISSIIGQKLYMDIEELFQTSLKEVKLNYCRENNRDIINEIEIIFEYEGVYPNIMEQGVITLELDCF